MFFFKRRKKKVQELKQKAVEVQQEPPVKEELVEDVFEPVETEVPVEEKVQEPEVETEEQEDEKEEKEEKAKPRKMAYHITKHPQGGWQIKKGGAQRALKRFDTQKEAIDYAKVLEKERGASYIIHKADGRTRKKTY